jgi:two-component system KDP operon response regulator KdpE
VSEAAPSVLIVDDEEQILRVLKPTLESQGYQVVTAGDGASALEVLSAGTFAVIILDLGLPDMDGKDVIQRVRAWTSVPIIVLSARHDESEKIAALDAGASDYLQKPFAAGELLARVRVALRASGRQITSDICALDGIAVDFRRRVAHLPERDVSLSAREAQFLRVLMERRGDIVSHRDIILAVWGDLDRADAQFVRVLAGQVRNKIEPDPHRPRWIVTVPGQGYAFGESAAPEVKEST